LLRPPERPSPPLFAVRWAALLTPAQVPASGDGPGSGTLAMRPAVGRLRLLRAV